MMNFLVFWFTHVLPVVSLYVLCWFWLNSKRKVTLFPYTPSGRIEAPIWIDWFCRRFWFRDSPNHMPVCALAIKMRILNRVYRQLHHKQREQKTGHRHLQRRSLQNELMSRYQPKRKYSAHFKYTLTSKIPYSPFGSHAFMCWYWKEFYNLVLTSYAWNSFWIDWAATGSNGESHMFQKMHCHIAESTCIKIQHDWPLYEMTAIVPGTFLQ